MGVSVTRIVKYILKGDKGDKGDKGEKGASLRGPQAWSDCAVGYSFRAGGQGDTWKDVVLYGDNYYSCVKNHTKTATNYPGSTEDSNNGYWQLGDKIELVATKILLATYALVKNLGVEAIDMKDSSGNILFQAKDGNVVCKTGTFENITFSGTMNGVSGSFKSLDCVNESGTKVGGIRFGSDGKMWFEGDLYNQGYDYGLQRGYRFYSSDLWCRGGFGARQRNTAVVIGSTIRYYTKGLDNSSYVQATLSPSTVSGQLCYEIHLYGTTGDYAGFPIDTVIFLPSSGTYYYRLIATAGKKVTLIGANDTNGDIKILSAGGYIDLNRGGYMDAIYLGSLYLPSTSNPGAGWLFSSLRDNNWG